jgi:hypothetical protein
MTTMSQFSSESTEVVYSEARRPVWCSLKGLASTLISPLIEMAI